MKSLNKYVSEKLIINKNYKNLYNYVPKSWNELREIIEQRYTEQGPGTKQKPIDFNDIDISNIDSFNDKNTGLFEETTFEYIDISGWDVSNVKDMRYMFFECKKLKSICDLSKWNVSGVKDMSYMFNNCEKLESVGNLSDWHVSNVKGAACIFYRCKKLKSVGDLSNWDISNVNDISYMFYSCQQLTSVGDLSNWDISNVEYMNYMFLDSGITNMPDWYKE